jgi:hypothetical protein
MLKGNMFKKFKKLSLGWKIVTVICTLAALTALIVAGGLVYFAIIVSSIHM